MDVLLPLALLACPIGMGLMMFFMARGMGMGGGKKEPTVEGDHLPTLKAEQVRLAEQIESLERQQEKGDRAARDVPQSSR